MTGSISTYSFVFLHGMRQAWADKAELASTVLLYIMVTLVFTMIYRVVPVKEFGLPELTTANLAWYVAITEIIVLTAGDFARELRDDIQGGRFTTLMQRPKEVLLLKLSDWTGQFAVYATLLLTVSIIWMKAITGSIPLHLEQIPLLFVALFLGAILYMTIVFSINLLEVWGRYARVGGWLSQKLMFVLGGLFFPPLLFPENLQSFAWITPYPAILYVPGSLVLDRPTDDILLGIAVQLVWVAVLVAGAYKMFAVAERHVLKEGD